MEVLWGGEGCWRGQDCHMQTMWRWRFKSFKTLTEQHLHTLGTAHLEKVHKTEHDKIVGKKNTPLNKAVKLKQPTLLNMANKSIPYGRNHRKQKQFDLNIKKQMIFDCLPFSIADSKLFRKTVNDLDPKIVVKQAKTYSRHINWLWKWPSRCYGGQWRQYLRIHVLEKHNIQT